MKKYENITMALEICAEESADRCDECPYVGKCRELRTDAARLIEELVDRLERPIPSCDHESIAQSHSEEIRKLHDELCRVNVEYERTQRELHEVRKELAYLRAIKATAEAFLGVKIDGQM